MFLEDYLKELRAIQKKYKGVKLQVIYASDDEGNNFYPVEYLPSVGIMNEDGLFDNNAENPKVICVN
jgi:hypothetical protein